MLCKRSAALRSRSTGCCCRLPIFGDILEKATIARWTRTLSTMFAAGVPLVESLDAVGGASGNCVYAAGTKQIQTEVSTGTSLTNAMTNTNAVPDDGAADDRRSARSRARSTTCWARSPTSSSARSTTRSPRSRRLLEPIIIVFLGVVIGGLVVAMYLPIFKLGAGRSDRRAPLPVAAVTGDRPQPRL